MTTSTVKKVQEELERLGNPDSALILQRFFKTGPGQYGDGDRFRGIRVPILRRLSSTYRSMSITHAEELLKSPFHEDRLLSLLILIRIFRKADEEARLEIYSIYLSNTAYINSWDLVDVSAEHIVGAYLADGSREPLYRLAQSESLWERRISILATFHFIRKGEFDETLRIAEMLLPDKEDLIRKATGWMLREVGKRDIEAEKRFLKEHHREMPRTMLRYAIERFPEEERKKYLAGVI